MTIDEAIEILDGLDRTYAPVLLPHRKEALNLGIQALQRIKEQRSLEACERNYLLLSETKD